MAFGQSTISDIGGAVSDIFSASLAAESDQIKAEGDFAEAKEYTLAEQLAQQNEAYAKTSTAIQTAQQQRQIFQTIGTQKAEVAGSGLAAGGSSLDLLRSSAQQGALAQAVTAQQGLITEAGYAEQAQSYGIMSAAAQQAGQEEQKLAKDTQTFGDINAAIKGVSAVASLFMV